MTIKDKKDETLLAHLGRDPERFQGAVNVPVFRASTILAPDLETWEDPQRRKRRGAVTYGRAGTPTSYALEETMAELEGGSGAVSLPSGLAAISVALLAYLEAGDHMLVTDAVYRPGRRLCDTILKRLGVETTYFDPLIGGDIAKLFRPNTRLVYLESPGSLTFEVQDVPAIAAAAKAAGLAVILDNSWATPLYFRSFEQGVDVSLYAGTKYVVGHSDAMLGLVVGRDREAEDRLRKTARGLGVCAGSEEQFLGLRGLRTLAVRLARHHQTALALAEWLAERPEVERVLYPPLPSDPGHALWQRDFTGASGLLGFALAQPTPRRALAAMIDGLELFGIGASWGGYESLIIPTDDELAEREILPYRADGPSLRIHAGLEDPGDLIADLDAGFARMREAARVSA